MKNLKLPALLNAPLGVVVVVGTVTLVVEYLFMELLHEYLMEMFKFSEHAWDLIDAITLVAVISPVLYFMARKMQEVEQRSRQICATAQDAIIIVDEQALITDWNLAAQRMFQYSHEEAVGQQLHQLIAPSRFHTDATRGFANFQMTGTGPLVGKTIEIAALRKDGSEFPIELSISAAKVKGRWHAMGVIRDITERKLAEQSLRAERDFAQSIITTAQVIVLLLDSKGRIVSFNPYMENLSGWHLEEVRGKDWFSTFLPERDRKDIRKLFQTAISGTSTRGNVNAMLTRNGRELQIEWFDNVLKDSKGEVTGLLAIGQDITERRRIEKNVEFGKRRLEAILETATDGIHILDADGLLVDANNAFLNMLGLDRTAINRLHVYDWDAQMDMESIQKKQGNSSRNATPCFLRAGIVAVTGES